MFNLTINTQNAAFEDGAEYEVGRILREIADKIENAGAESGANVLDYNGNRVGRYSLDQS